MVSVLGKRGMAANELKADSFPGCIGSSRSLKAPNDVGDRGTSHVVGEVAEVEVYGDLGDSEKSLLGVGATTAKFANALLSTQHPASNYQRPEPGPPRTPSPPHHDAVAAAATPVSFDPWPTSTGR